MPIPEEDRIAIKDSKFLDFLLSEEPIPPPDMVPTVRISAYNVFPEYVIMTTAEEASDDEEKNEYTLANCSWSNYGDNC